MVSFITIAFEDKESFNYPKFFFYEDLDDENPYKIAYNFQYEIINNITEESCLFQPFLLLDSYIMDNIHSKNFKFVEYVKSGYSISMLRMDLIKEHLLKSIKNYFFVLKKTTGKNARTYRACMQKFSKIVTYNENVLLSESKYENMYDLGKSDYIFHSKDIKNYAFTINLENIHENLSHVKESIINIKESPTLYFNRNMNLSFIYNMKDKNIGEAGRLVEEFIGELSDIQTMKKSIYDMSEFLDFKYFIGKDFNLLIEGFKNATKANNQNRSNYNLNLNSNKILNNCEIVEELNKEQNEPNDVDKQQNNKNSLSNSKGKSNIENDQDSEIILSEYNTYTITADSYEDLEIKIGQLKNKKIKYNDNAIKYSNKMCWY